uniref:Serine/threonine-protein phosphatase with EF-hands n=1 Tax=Latimeria chalumnae TaxID=7897 RepID=H3ARN2_LATCH
VGGGTVGHHHSSTGNKSYTMKAAILIQRWYRRYVARIEMRRRYTWSIFQSIEYAGEQDQLQLSNFFSFLLDHYTQVKNTGKDLFSLLFTPTNGHAEDTDKNIVLEYEKIKVPESYTGPRLNFPLTVADTNTLLQAFKQQHQLHARYVLQLLHETKKIMKQKPNIIHLSTSCSKEITICGDLHGKLDDLMLIFYKNGLPSTEKIYLFNGDLVDRGENSMEILIILFAFLLVHPAVLHLNRGNHEDYIMNLRYGFTKEVMQKYKLHSTEILELVQDVFSWLPLATIIDNKVLIVHGGIAETTDLNLLNSLERDKIISSNSIKIIEKKKQKLEKKKGGISSWETIIMPWFKQLKKKIKLSLFNLKMYTFACNSNNQGFPCKGCLSSCHFSIIKLKMILHIHNGEYVTVGLCVTVTKMDIIATCRNCHSFTVRCTKICYGFWRKVVDVLWSDPKGQFGCTPNNFRGGGCYFGPDVTAKFLRKYNLKLLIRSHECKQDGYEFCHNDKVITIFSASNYYEEGSNRGAYIKLGPDLVPHFVQYQVSKSTRRPTLRQRQRVNIAEHAALRSLKEKLYTCSACLLSQYPTLQSDETLPLPGRISVNEWASAIESVLTMDLPWRTMRSRLVRLSPDGKVEYLSCFEDLWLEKPVFEKVQLSLMETLCRYRTDLEVIFNVIDKDHSGLISIEEFHQTWKLFSSHFHINIDDAVINDLARSIDSNNDGSIDFNEFLEAFRVVHK